VKLALRHLSGCPATLVLVGLSALASWPGLPLGELLVCAREAVARGELWRLVSGPLVHASAGHALRDLLVLLAVGLVYERRMGWALRATLLVSLPVVSVVALASHASVAVYLGLSGTVYAAVVAALSWEWLRARGRPAVWVMLLSALMVGKVIVEAATGSLLLPSPLPEGVIALPGTHLAGGLCGVACAAVRGRVLTPALVALGLLVVPLPARAAPRTVVAVLDVQARRVRLGKPVRSILRAVIAAYLTESGAYRAVPEERVRRALSRLRRRSFSDRYDPTTRIELGVELAARQAVATRVGRVGRRCVVTASLLDLRTATTERAATLTGRCSEPAILASVRAVVQRLAAPGAMPATGAALRSDEARRFRRGCTLGVMADCRRLGWLFQVGRGVPRSRTRAAALYRGACLRGDALGCTNLGFLHARGDGVAHDVARAAAYYRLGCAGGSAIGCHNLADHHISADRRHRAVTLFRWACDRGFEPSCRRLAGLRR
jgi:rhomboid family GlyGly-CTERM serine protease